MAGIYTVEGLRDRSGEHFKRNNYHRDLTLRVPLSKIIPDQTRQLSWFVMRLCRRDYHTIYMLQGGNRWKEGRVYPVRALRTVAKSYVLCSVSWETGKVIEHSAFVSQKLANQAARFAFSTTNATIPLDTL